RLAAWRSVLCLVGSHPPRRRRETHPRAGGRRGNRPDKADPGGVGTMHWLLPSVFAALLVLGSALGANAADLVVWWEKGFNPEEDEAVREIVSAFEQGGGKHVDLVFGQQEKL